MRDIKPLCESILPGFANPATPVDGAVELDQTVLERSVDPRYFRAPARAVHLPKARQAAHLDRRETEIFRKRTNLRCCAFIVARQEHDSSATMDGRILIKDGSDQMVEALDQSSTSEGLRDDLGRRLSSQVLGGTP
jgi:hypothetical protein